MISLKVRQRRGKTSLSDSLKSSSSTSDILRPSSSGSETSMSSTSDTKEENLGFFMNQDYSPQNEDSSWSESNLPANLFNTPSPPSTTLESSSPPPRRRSTRAAKNVQPKLDQFFARTEKPITPTKRKAMANNVEDLLTEIAEEPLEPPRKKVVTTPLRQPSRATPPKSRKAAAKVKELPSLENATLNKPEAWGEPPVWAEKRQQLCSSLPYHKGYESAAYRTNGMIAGFLVNQGVGPRDVFTEDIYITSVGGGKSKGEDGETKRVKDQDFSSIAISFQRTMEAKLPIAMIAGQRNTICPVKLNHHFNVLDFFHITDIWCELESGLKMWKVRMEKIDLTKRSWWSPIDSTAHLSQGYDGLKTTVQTCCACNTSRKTIYTQGWTCRSPQCEAFYVFDHPVDVDDLQYCAEFLQERTPYTGAAPPPLRPEPVTNADLVGEDIFGVEERCKQGIVCPKCHGCIRRLEWRQWTCETPDCDFTHTVTQVPVPITKAIEGNNIIADQSPILFAHESVRVSHKPIGHYDVYELQLPGETTEAGWIQVFRSNGLINSQPDGPNELFQGMQKDDYKLRRGPARHPGLPMEIVTAHFASNFGAPYKFLVAHEANSFRDAPVPILQAMQRMTWAGQQAFSGKKDADFTPFNEVLALGYFENMHIGYHDDGEDTLGETVATLSLGASSTMCFRPKNKSTIGGVLKPGKGSLGSKATKKDYVKVTLNHGDIIVMHGSGIHKYYEHAVTPHGLLRFALTCRHVKPELLSPEDRIICTEKSVLPANFADYAYDGDIGVSENPSRPTNEGDDDDLTKLKKYIVAKKLSGELTKADCQELRDIILDI
ncbi:uncharacterized protein EAF01_003141 [Botrytis porri]|uniref:uncharacterized protein n=1 Tax=Botrytis porri TaxID=87229 RepID=UPI0019024345|nr:uncharacterized protein EAF01_003141 [Botrytis porri]KAF7909423.1 hypothetical protein EAF01_003141 [Botrytis porri]